MREDRVHQLMLECIQTLQQHTGLEPSMYRSYLLITHGDDLKRYGVSVETVCAEWEKHSHKRKAHLLPTPNFPNAKHEAALSNRR